MRAFYESFYPAVADSQAHRAFCERVYGQDLGQHGFMDQGQLDLLLDLARPGPGQRVLDLGCGNGLIAEYIGARTGAHVTGIDYIESAIAQARARTLDRADQLDFMVGDINRLALPPTSFDLIIAIDTIYFSDDYAATIAALRQALRPGGRLAFFYSYGREPWVPREQFPAEDLAAERTPLGRALRAGGLAFQSWDLTSQDEELARRRQAALAELRPQFAAEGNLFIYENRLGDAEGIAQAIAEGLHRRYLYLTIGAM